MVVQDSKLKHSKKIKSFGKERRDKDQGDLCPKIAIRMYTVAQEFAEQFCMQMYMQTCMHMS